jgi:endonuclease G
MIVDAQTMKRARHALRKAVSKYLFDRNVSMIDFGYPEHFGQIAEDELAIRIHVQKKLSGPQLEAAAERGFTEPIPETIDGFPTDVPEGIYRTQLFWGWRTTNPRAVRSDPMRGGISISNARHHTYATLGALVRDRTTGEDMILSNWHVLAGSWSAQPGLGILQPGRLDGGSSADTVASLARDGMAVNLDAAVATLTGTRRLINDQMELGPVKGLTEPVLGMNVAKSGRRTEITRGRVTAIEGVVRLRYDWVERLIRNVITIEPHSPFEETSRGGDSGSTWMNEESSEAVGLHFAGSDFPERALAMDMRAVLDALAVNLVTEVEPIRLFVTAMRARELAPA